MIKLHNGAWVDENDVDAITPTRDAMNGAFTLILMKSGSRIKIYPRDGHKSWADRRDLMPDVEKEADEIAGLIMQKKA